MDPFAVLPNELCIEILSLLLHDLTFLTQSVSLVSSHWAHLASSEIIWKKIAYSHPSFRSLLNWVCFERDSDSEIRLILREHYTKIRANWASGSYTTEPLKGHKNYIRCVRFDERNIAVSSSVDKTVRVWDLKKGTCLHVLEGHSAEVDCVDIAGDTIASGSFDSTVRLWDLQTGECKSVIKENGHVLMWCVKLFPETNYVLCPSADSSLALWDSERGEVLQRWTHNSISNLMCLYSEGSRVPTGPLLTGSSDKIVRYWDNSTGVCISELAGHTDSLWAVHYSHGSVITTSSDKTVKMWDLRSGSCTSTMTGHMGTVFCMWAEAGYIVSGDSNDWLFVWDINTQTVLHKWHEHDGGLRSVQHDNYKIVSASWDKTIKVWTFM